MDGDGSKCAAVVEDRCGGSWRGEGGPCNVTDVGVAGTVSSVATAVQGAIDACLSLGARHIKTIQFAQFWVGLAGFDRPSVSAPMTAAPERMFSRRISMTFRIATDIELLVTTAVRHRKVASVIALIAGTGSIAMSFSRNGAHFARTGRTGSWGYLLGDDGSGFDNGRRAIRHCLASLDRQRNGKDIAPSCGSTCRLCQRLLHQFAVDSDPNQGSNLLSAVISSVVVDESRSGTNVQRRIASVAPIVIGLCETNAIAGDIIDRAIKNLIELLQSLHTSASVGPATNALVLAGSLLRNVLFRSKLTSAISRLAAEDSQTVTFDSMICVPDPTATGAETLLEDPADV